MISAGRNIKSTNDDLQKVELRYLFDAIRNPKQELLSLLRQLRVVRQLNPNQYRTLKTRLPYVVCGIFNPPYRKTENFAYTQYFIIDIDHLNEKEILLEDLREKIKHDPRTLLCFVSPSGDGLKVMMKLSEKCYDAGLYKTFYQAFLSQFSKTYQLQQVVDSKTCDVARACFFSSDDKVYYNPNAETIQLHDYLNPDTNPHTAIDIKNKAEQEAKIGDKLQKKETHASPDPGSDIMEEIRKKLNPRIKEKTNKSSAYVPEILNDIADDLMVYIQNTGIIVQEVININYGKKIRARINIKQAEVNLFYGKRGFSVVLSPRTGTDIEANELLKDVINSFLAEKMI